MPPSHSLHIPYQFLSKQVPCVGVAVAVLARVDVDDGGGMGGAVMLDRDSDDGPESVLVTAGGS